MGKFFAVATLESGRRGTIWFDELPKVGDTTTIYFYDEIGMLVNDTGKITEIK